MCNKKVNSLKNNIQLTAKNNEIKTNDYKYITCIGLLLRLLISQQQTVLSFDPDTTTEESSLYSTQFTAAACCRNLRFTLPSDTSHNTTDLSAPHDTNSLGKKSL